MTSRLYIALIWVIEVLYLHRGSPPTASLAATRVTGKRRKAAPRACGPRIKPPCVSSLAFAQLAASSCRAQCGGAGRDRSTEDHRHPVCPCGERNRPRKLGRPPTGTHESASYVIGAHGRTFLASTSRRL